jgi:hypothetical protein
VNAGQRAVRDGRWQGALAHTAPSPVPTRVPEPTRHDLDEVVRGLEATWTATVTVARRSVEDVGYREIYVSIDGTALGFLRHGEALTVDIPPGPHELHAHNTLFRRTLPFSVTVGEHAGFTAVNRAGAGTYSVLAFFIGFLGAGPLYLTLERDRADESRHDVLHSGRTGDTSTGTGPR